jgi:hypothetical protein
MVGSKIHITINHIYFESGCCRSIISRMHMNIFLQNIQITFRLDIKTNWLEMTIILSEWSDGRHVCPWTVVVVS